MDKNKLMKYFLVMLPVLAVGLATTGNAVSVYSPDSDTFAYGSFFALIPSAGEYQTLPPLAGIMALACAVVTAVWAIRGGKKTLRAAMYLCAAGAILAVIPTAFSRQYFVIPSPFFALILTAHFVLASVAEKKAAQQEKTGKRLGEK